MIRTIDNEKTQVCCKYKDSTSIIQMNKGHNYVQVSNINLLAAPGTVLKLDIQQASYISENVIASSNNKHDYSLERAPNISRPIFFT